ncbi:protease SohB [Vibrio owensii]|uniref:protease SohB n=1 Tax=Vibrio owensii TaxID=696485 RepID=UPI003CC64133
MDVILDVLVFGLKAGLVVAAFALIAGLGAKAAKDKLQQDGKIKVTKISDRLSSYHKSIDKALLSEDDFQTKWKGVKPIVKPNRLFVIDFDGDIEASEVEFLREEVTSVIATGCNSDKVLIRIKSGGGTVDGYGLVASQIHRLKDAGFFVTVSVDRVAASGGYMAAVVADEIIAAPFSYIGSIGVIGQVPNIHKLLKSKGVEIEQHTAGEFKRTLTTMGETTDKARDKFKQDLERMHKHFQEHITRYRPEIDINKVSTGEVWNGLEALDLKLIDGVKVSDDFIGESLDSFEVVEIRYEPPKNPNTVLSSLLEQVVFKPVAKLVNTKILA